MKSAAAQIAPSNRPNRRQLREGFEAVALQARSSRSNARSTPEGAASGPERVSSQVVFPASIYGV